MVLSLADLSLRSVSKGIKNGTIRHPHLLPPTLRQGVLDAVLKDGLDDVWNGLEDLTSVEFLIGMTSISIQAAHSYDDTLLLNNLVASMSTILPNGETAGAAIKKLDLKVFDHIGASSTVSDLIGHCPNTTSLALSNKGVREGYRPINENSTCNGVMENLIELSLRDWSGIFNSERPIINFRRLKALKLGNCFVNADHWPILLESIPFVENLHLLNLSMSESPWEQQMGFDCILPFPLPHLKSLEVIGDEYIFNCNKTFVDNLTGCPQLRQVHLMLDHKSYDEESLTRLASMDIVLKIKARIVVTDFNWGPGPGQDGSLSLDSSSRFKIVNIFHEKIYSFELCVQVEWLPKYSTALEDVVNTCSNLTKFGIKEPQIRYTAEKKRVNAALIRFFDNFERAQQLEELCLVGDFDEYVLSAVFENCLNLKRLEVFDCPTLRDQHLIYWVSRGGGNLTHFVVHGWRSKVTRKGIKPIMVKSAERLLRYHIPVYDYPGKWETLLRSLCPNAVFKDNPCSKIL